MAFGGTILYSDSTNRPIFAAIDEPTGNPVFGTRPAPDIWGTITIHFEDGDDLDILGYWTETGSGGGVGWAHAASIGGGGMFAFWGGDNTSGGPETIRVGGEEGHEYHGLHTFRIHFNWYRTGEGHSGGGAHVVATGKNGTQGDAWGGASHRQSSAANTGDPYVDVVYDSFGLLVSVG